MMTFWIERDIILRSPPLLVELRKPIGLNSITAHNSTISQPNEEFCLLTFEIEINFFFVLPQLLVGLIERDLIFGPTPSPLLVGLI